MIRNIESKNLNGQYHGYQEWYLNNKIIVRGNCKNDKPIGYMESHNYNKETTYHIR